MRTAESNIVNLIFIGDELLNLNDLTEPRKCEIGMTLNRQSLTAVGYTEVKEGTDKTA